MQVLVTYDIANTESKEGAKRLRMCAQVCKNHGQRVQMSVFECTVDESSLQMLTHELRAIIDPELDSVRMYRLSHARDRLVKVLGRDKFRDPDAPLIL
jgi:CRISPR-associated protein Cas2